MTKTAGVCYTSGVTRSDSICFGLLAGGQSRRMGVDKAFLDWHGQPLWRHQLRLAADIDASEILISGRPDRPYRDDAQVVPDLVAECGPLAGLCALLQTMASKWLVAVAVDMPLLDGGTLCALADACRGQTGVVPVVNNRPEPLAAVYPRAVLALAQQQLKSTDRSLQCFVRAAVAAKLVQLLPVRPEHADCFRSLNTPAEFAAAQRRAAT